MSQSLQPLGEPFRLKALLAEAWRTLLPSWRTVGPTVLYCLRTLTAISLALYVAFALQLQAPLSSVVTVLIVANPVTGALVSKSLWRLLGTAVGAIVAVLLIAGFAQSPLLFAILFSLWIGLACVASTLLRYFKAYGAVLAGYTIVIVSGPAFADPENVFTSALSRLSAVSIGIASAALVFLLTTTRPPSRLGPVSLALIRDAAATLGRYVTTTPLQAADGPRPAGLLGAVDGPDLLYDRRGSLLAQANGLNEIIEYAAAESPSVSRQADQLRLGVAGLMGTLTALNPLVARIGNHQALADDVREAIDTLASLQLEAPGPALRSLAEMRDRLAPRGDQAPQDGKAASLDHLAAVARAHDLLGRLHDSVARLTRHSAALPNRTSQPRLRMFLDWPTALRNGARGGIVTVLAMLFWYVTQWPAGPTLLAYLVPAACLLATNPSASRASIDFSIGTLMAVPASYVCETVMLPHIAGFPLLLGVLAICLLPGIWFQFHPRFGLRAFGYVVFFNAMLSIRNPIGFDGITLLNNWLAFILGTAALIIVFRALLPPNHRLDADRLVHSVTRAVARLGRVRRLPAIEVWESLQMQKALRLVQRLQPLQALPANAPRAGASPAGLPPGMAPRKGQAIIDCTFVAIELGRNLLRLRLLLAQAVLEPPERMASVAALKAASQLRYDPNEAAILARQAAQLLAARLTDAGVPPPGLLRIAALLHDIAMLIETIPDFLRRDYAVS